MICIETTDEFAYRRAQGSKSFNLIRPHGVTPSLGSDLHDKKRTDGRVLGEGDIGMPHCRLTRVSLEIGV